MPERSIPLDDLTIRSALRSKLLADHAEEGDTALMEELGLCRGRVRVDLALVNGHLNGYEIKSDRDTLTRLETQAEIYMKVFDRLTIVVGSKHLSSIGTRLPEWWGILQAIQGATAALSGFETYAGPNSISREILDHLLSYCGETMRSAYSKRQMSEASAVNHVESSGIVSAITLTWKKSQLL